MKKQWKNHNINLQHLAQTIQDHYTEKNIKTRTFTQKNGYQIFIILTKLRTPTMMAITLLGTPNNFTIETKATEYEDEAVKLGLSTTIFGGGSLIPGNIKAREELEKLEQEFWTTIEETIATLTNPK